jgi:DNA-binding transcriptional regulator YdaS (Cro superfamily)
MLENEINLWFNFGMENTHINPVEQAASILGGVDELAKACGVSPQAAYKWIKKRAPADRCLEIESLTGHQVTRYDLRPDVFGANKEPRSKAA